MLVYDLNDENCDMISIKAYNGNKCLMSEYENDIKRIKYIKRLIGKYVKRGDLKERLILNHIIIMGNVFTPELTTKLLFLKIQGEYHSALKTFLEYLGYLPDKILYINGKIIDTKKIPKDQDILERLKEI